MQWLEKIFRKKNTPQGIIGISFLSNGIAIAVANYTKNNALKFKHCEFIEVKNPKEYAAIFKKWIIERKLGNYNCHLVLNINDYHCINIEAPNVPENETALAIRWKINELLDFPLDDSVIDYYPMPAQNNNLSMLEVIACPLTIIKPLIEQCQQAGLSLHVIDIQETSLRNLATLLPKNELGVAVLYLQQASGIILIQKAGIIYMAHHIAIGYENLTSASQYDNLALEIQRSLDYADSYYGIYGLTELAVIPWATDIQNLLDNLSDNYDIDAYPMDLSTLINIDSALDYPTQSLCAPVIGTTLRHIIGQHDNTAS